MFVSQWIALDRRDMHTSLVRKSTRADKRRRRSQLKVRDLTHESRRFAQLPQTFRSNRVTTQLQFEVRNDGTQVRIAATLAIAIDRSLHMTRTGTNRGKRVCNCELAIVVTVNAYRNAQLAFDFACNAFHVMRQTATVRIAEHDSPCARISRYTQRLQRILRIRAKPVEKMLRVI